MDFEQTKLALAQSRRRLEIFSLRWQARLDTKRFDQAVPWVMALLLGAALSGLALTRAHQLDAGADLSVHLQGLWLIGEGFEPRSRPATTYCGSRLRSSFIRWRG